MADTLAPIIIKKIKKGGHGHHGGAWKVAYADFVTAMMAFFLLLWLLNVTTPEQKKGIADYFTPTIGIKDSKGIGFKGGKKSTPEGTSRSDLAPIGLVVGQVQQGPAPQAPNTDTTRNDPDAESSSTAQKAEDDKQDSDVFKSTSNDINQAIEDDPDLKKYKSEVIVQDTPEGLKIDIIDDEKKPMFAAGRATLTADGKKVLDSMANIINKTPNNITINGHTDAGGANANQQYTNWELSADRANAARREFVLTQLNPARVMKIIGLADRQLLMPNEPNSPRNRRITVILMRGSYFRDPKSAPTTRALLSVPDAQVKKPDEPKQDAPKPPEEIKATGMFDPNAPTQPPESAAPPLPPAGQ